jgi:signal transduction histidine kinase
LCLRWQAAFSDGEEILYIARSLVFTVIFWLSWQASILFVVAPNASAFYIPPGLSVAFIAMFGWRYIPAVFVAALATSSLNVFIGDFSYYSTLHSIVHAVSYGFAGVLFGQVWQEQSHQLSLKSAMALFFITITASFLSAIAAYGIFDRYDLVPLEALGQVLLSFWVGDFAGVMLVSPIVLILFTQLSHASFSDLTRKFSVLADPKIIGLQLGCILTAIASVLLPFQLGVSGEFFFICAIPIAIAGLWFGVIKGILATGITVITIAVVQNLAGVEYSNVIDLQLFIGLAASIALMAGGSRDDRELAQGIEEKLRRELHDYATSSADWFWETDADHRVTYRSEIVGVPISYDYGKSRAEVAAEDTNSAKWQEHLNILQQRKPFKDFAYAWRGPDGSILIVSASGIPLFKQDGTFIGYRGTTSDVSQLRQAQKMEAVGKLTSGITHDFNNILHVILANMEIVKIVHSDGETSKRIDSTIAAVERGANLTDQLLSFSRTDSTNMQHLSVTNIIRDMDGLIAKSLAGSRRVEFELDQDVWPIMADGGELQNVMLNLSINAGHAMADDGVLTILTANDSHSPDGSIGDHVMISVSDNGTGMTQEIVSKIFDPFFTTKERVRGTGLGLSMVHGYVRRSGGRIDVESELGTGTTFKIYLPRSVSDGSAADADLLESKSPLPGSERILNVDDEIGISETTQSFLETPG